MKRRVCLCISDSQTTSQGRLVANDELENVLELAGLFVMRESVVKYRIMKKQGDYEMGNHIYEPQHSFPYAPISTARKGHGARDGIAQADGLRTYRHWLPNNELNARLHIPLVAHSWALQFTYRPGAEANFGPGTAEAPSWRSGFGEPPVDNKFMEVEGGFPFDGSGDHVGTLEKATVMFHFVPRKEASQGQGAAFLERGGPSGGVFSISRVVRSWSRTIFPASSSSLGSGGAGRSSTLQLLDVAGGPAEGNNGKHNNDLQRYGSFYDVDGVGILSSNKDGAGTETTVRRTHYTHDDQWRHTPWVIESFDQIPVEEGGSFLQADTDKPRSVPYCAKLNAPSLFENQPAKDSVLYPGEQGEAGVSRLGQEVGDTEKLLRIHKKFSPSVSPCPTSCWPVAVYVSSRTWDSIYPRIYPPNRCVMGTTEW